MSLFVLRFREAARTTVSFVVGGSGRKTETVFRQRIAFRNRTTKSVVFSFAVKQARNTNPEIQIIETAINDINDYNGSNGTGENNYINGTNAHVEIATSSA